MPLVGGVRDRDMGCTSLGLFGMALMVPGPYFLLRLRERYPGTFEGPGEKAGSRELAATTALAVDGGVCTFLPIRPSVEGLHACVFNQSARARQRAIGELRTGDGESRGWTVAAAGPGPACASTTEPNRTYAVAEDCLEAA